MIGFYIKSNIRFCRFHRHKTGCGQASLFCFYGNGGCSTVSCRNRNFISAGLYLCHPGVGACKGDIGNRSILRCDRGLYHGLFTLFQGQAVFVQRYSCYRCCHRDLPIIDGKFHGFPGASFGCHNHHRACRTFLLRLSCYITIVQTKSLRQFTSFLQCEGCILPAGYCVAVGSVNTIPEQIAIIRLPHLQIRDIPKLTVRKPEYCRFLPFKGHFGKQIPSFIAKPVSIV